MSGGYTSRDRKLAKGDREDHQRDRKGFSDDRRLVAARRRQEIAFAWIRFVVGLVVGVALAVFISYYILRDNLIASCIRGSEFKVVEARVWEKASAQRAEDGDEDTAKFYAETARHIRFTIPVSPRDRSVPRGEIAANRVGGCEDSYPAPLPFVE